MFYYLFLLCFIFIMVFLKNNYTLKKIIFLLIIFFFFKNVFYIIDLLFLYLFSNFNIFFFFFFLLNIFFSAVFISFLGYRGVFLLNLFSLCLLFLNCFVNYKTILFFSKTYKYNFGTWFIVSSNYKINFSIFIDHISFSFLLLTTTIGFCVYIFSFFYFKYEPLVDRFLLFLLLFLGSMIMFVISNNIIMLFLGWELIGITSFLLINFWSSKISSLKSAFKAFFFNKLSDIFLFIFILLLTNIFYTFDINTINSEIHFLTNISIFFLNLNFSILEFLNILLISAASIKSAQIGPHIWLPDSMEAPVPASALIHSATLVSAGIFLLLRFNNFLEISFYSNIIIGFLGALTAFLGSFLACFSSDVKKILAYSTISHCGFLFFLVSSGIIEFTLFYLFCHGFFKAASFMCLGNILRFSRGYQDFRKMGGFWKYLPFEVFIMFICLFNLSGLPFSLGFFLKHFVFLSFNFYYSSLCNFILLFIAALLSIIYSFRLFFFIFFDYKKSKKSIYLNKKNNFSIYFSNSSKGTMLAISLLLILSYFILFELYKNILFKYYIYYNLNNNIFINNRIFITYFAYMVNLNFSFLTFIFFFIFFIYFFIDWRKNYFFKSKLMIYSEFIIFIFFLYILKILF